MNVRWLFTLSALIFVTRDARAQVPTSVHEEQPRITLDAQPRAQHTVWYGWQVLVADAASATIMGAALALTPDRGSSNVNAGFFFAGVGAHAVAAPAVHLANGELGRAAGSLGMRVGATTLGFALGVAMAPGCGEEKMCFNALGGGFIGGLVGMVTASALDASVLAYKRDARQQATLSIAPELDPARNAYGVRLVATGW